MAMRFSPFLIAIFFLSWVSGAEAQTQWDHNGSTVTLSANGANRQFTYAVPRPGLPVTSGTLLFSGRKVGDRYLGTAYIFSERCGATGYSVAGPVSADQRSVTMYGKAPRINSACQVTGYSDDVLVFSFQEPSMQTPGVTAGSVASTLICLYPVFAEERTLREKIDGNRSTTEWVGQAINYLHAKYCREVDETPEQDDSTQLAETCFQYSGMFRGERVYWGGCFE